MFSPNIQNLINTSGQTAAMTRAAQLTKYVDNFNKKINTPVTSTNTTETPKFSDVLQQSIGDDYKFRDTGASKVIFGSLVKPSSQINKLKNINNIKSINAASDIDNTNSVTSTKKYSKDEIFNIISEISAKHGVNEKLVRALIKQESGFNPTVVSKAGAMGLMQLMPQTAKGLGVVDAKDPVQNVDGGVRYLKSMMKKYNGNVILALAAYNAGPGAVDKYGGVPPYKETQNYVKNILANYLG